MSVVFTGRCLCGDVSYESAVEPVVAGHCHCNDCRKTSATGHASHMVVPKQFVRISGELKFYNKEADSGYIVRRGFCPNCGSQIYSLNSGMPDMYFIRANSLDDLSVFKPQMIVYTSRAAGWDYMDPELVSFPAMPEKMPV